MSTTVIQQGYIAVLIRPIEEDAQEELREKLYDDKTILGISYDGKLLYSDSYQEKEYSEREFHGDLFITGSQSNPGRDKFIEQATNAGLHIDVATIQPYTCIYYNGVDSPLDMLTKEEFMEKK